MSELDLQPEPERTPTPEVSAQPAQGSYAAPPPPPAPPKKRRGMFFFGVLGGCLVILAGAFFLFVAAAMMGSRPSGEFSLSTAKVAVVPLEGEIIESRDFIETLQKYEKNPTVRAIVVRINSPGGAIAPSQEIYAAIRHARAKSGKPIVASLDSVAASGGYYVAAACDQIVANPGSITGSIGVILQWFEMKDLVQWAKMKPETITSGPLKAAGSPFKELTEAERQYFQSIVSQMHRQFVRAIAEGRKGKISEAEVMRLADGRVFTGEEALRLKLVDRLGTMDDAVRVAGSLAGIRGEPTRIWPRPRQATLIDLLTNGESESSVERILSRKLPRFLYRW